MNKRILFFIGGSYVSGLEIITLHLIRELKKRGFIIHCIISGWNDGVFKKRLQELNVSFDEIKLGWIYFRKPLWTINTLVHYPAAVIKIRKSIKRFNPDVIHFCYYGVVVMLYPLINRKAVYALHETHAPTFKHRIFYRLLNRKINRFTAVSGHIGRVLERLAIPPKKIQVIYNGIPVRHEKPIQPPAVDTLVFSIIGQIVPWKGHQTLVEAASILVKEGYTGFSVCIFGGDTGEFAGALKQQIREKQLEKYFVWKGFINDQDSIYKSVDVVIVPSLSEEPCSLTIIESMMYAKPVIVSNRGGNPELVQDMKTGLVFAADSAMELSNCMSVLLKDNRLRYTLADNGFDHAVADLTVERMTSEYENLYNDLLK